MDCVSCGSNDLDEYLVCKNCGKQQDITEKRTAVSSQIVSEYPTVLETHTLQEEPPTALQAQEEPIVSMQGQADEHVAVLAAEDLSNPTAQAVVGASYPQSGAPSIYPAINAAMPTSPMQSQPGYPGYPPAYPVYPGYPSYPGYPPVEPVSPAPPKPPRGIAKTLPVWAFILGILVLIGGLVAIFFTGSDWANGALFAAFAAAGMAFILMLVLGIRSIAGMASRANPRRLSQYICSILVILILFTSSGLGLIAHTSLHTVQAHYQEGQQQWKEAIAEYELGGEKAPASSNIARTYAAWGENLSQQGHFNDAINKFELIIHNYTADTLDINRAQKDESRAYIDWGKQNLQQHNYMDAIDHLSTVLNLTYCTNSCKDEASPLAATATYDQAETLLGQKQYRDAVLKFRDVQSNFPQSPEVKKQHSDMSKALLGQGKVDRTNVCESAIPVYQELASKFADTPEGKQAKGELSAPQLVKGHFATGVPKESDGYSNIIATLMPNLNTSIPQDEFYQMLNTAPTADISANGNFVFQPLKQGTYDLAWGFTRADGSRLFSFYHYKDTGNAFYVAKIGPLCPFDFGDIRDKFLQG